MIVPVSKSADSRKASIRTGLKTFISKFPWEEDIETTTSFPKTRTLHFRAAFLPSPAYGALYSTLFRPYVQLDEPSLGTLLECARLAGAHSTLLGPDAERLAEECYALVLALVSMYRDDSRLPSAERHCLEDVRTQLGAALARAAKAPSKHVHHFARAAADALARVFSK